MPVIVEVAGPSAVGKTTLVRALARAMDGQAVPEVLETRVYRPPKPESASDLLRNQVLLVEEVASVYIGIRRSRIGKFYFLDTGIIDILLFTKYYPKTQGVDWDVFGDLARHTLEIECRSGVSLAPDVILYLSASEETLRQRRASDVATSRRHHEENLRLLPHEQAYYRAIANRYLEVVHVIDAEAGPTEVSNQARTILEWWAERRPDRPSLRELLDIMGCEHG